MKKAAVKEIITDFHAGQLPPVKKRSVEVPLNSGKIITLSGVRRSGKTFILFDTIHRLLSEGVPPKKILYINFEDERLDLVQSELDLLLQAYRELYPDIAMSETWLFFDEIQNISGWEKFVRRVYDTITKRLFITGSNAKLLSREIATSLRGRTISEEVFPLSFREYLSFCNAKIDLNNSQARAKIIHLFEKYLMEGGFPETVLVEDVYLRRRILQEYYDVMLYRDLIERYEIVNIPVLKYFLKRIFENITSTMSVNNIYNELKSQGYRIGKNSLYEYLDEAVSIYLFLILKKQSGSVLKQELGEKKTYAIDNGLLNAVTYKHSRDYGKLLENVIFLELYRSNAGIYFHKDKKECDFVVAEGSGEKHCIQVCYDLSDRRTRQREIEGLEDACRRNKLREGHILTFSEEETIRGKDLTIHVLPAYKFLLSGFARD